MEEDKEYRFQPSTMGFSHVRVWHLTHNKNRYQGFTFDGAEHGLEDWVHNTLGGAGHLVNMFTYCMSIRQFHSKYTVANSVDSMISELFRSTARIQQENRMEHINDTWNCAPVMVPLLFKHVVSNYG